MPTVALSKLACGEPNTGELSDVLSHHATMLESLLSQLVSISGNLSDEPITVIGPFLGRSILELSYTALLGRIDPFRVLYVRQCQRQATYDIGERRATSVQWAGDIVAKDNPPNDLWSASLNIDKISRALLSDYYDHLYWRQAFLSTLDKTAGMDGGDWLVQLRSTDPDSFLSRIRGESKRLFSSLSKGIHHEFVVPPATLYDRATVCDLIGDVIRCVGSLTLVSHQIAHLPFCLKPEVGVEFFKKIQELEIK